MDRVEMIEARLALVTQRLAELTAREATGPRLPAWFRTLAASVAEVEKAAQAAGVPPEDAWRPCQGRRAVVAELRKRGWSVNKVARVLRMNERSVRRGAKIRNSETQEGNEQGV